MSSATASTPKPSGLQGGVPRVVWTYWHQGLGTAPRLVRECVTSWVRLNPDWRVVVLDKDSVHNHTRLPLPESVQQRIGIVKVSDLLRVQLLAEHGGVWADATVLCRKPLDSWLPQAASAGFFAFHRPGPDRLIASWLLAAAPQAPLVVETRNRYRDFFLQNPAFDASRQFRRRTRALAAVLNRSTHTTRLWFSPLITRGLKVFPFFLLHYCFAEAVRREPACAEQWKRMPRIAAEPPHLIQRLGMRTPLTEALAQRIAADTCPLYKLSRHHDTEQNLQGTLLEHLFSTLPPPVP